MTTTMTATRLRKLTRFRGGRGLKRTTQFNPRQKTDCVFDLVHPSPEQCFLFGCHDTQHLLAHQQIVKPCRIEHKETPLPLKQRKKTNQAHSSPVTESGQQASSPQKQSAFSRPTLPSGQRTPLKKTFPLCCVLYLQDQDPVHTRRKSREPTN